MGVTDRLAQGVGIEVECDDLGRWGEKFGRQGALSDGDFHDVVRGGDERAEICVEPGAFDCLADDAIGMERVLTGKFADMGQCSRMGRGGWHGSGAVAPPEHEPDDEGCQQQGGKREQAKQIEKNTLC